MRSKKRLWLLCAAAIAAGSLVFTTAASGEGAGGNRVLVSSLAPSVPTDPAFHGKTPGGVPWVLSSGQVFLFGSGFFLLDVRGLVIPSLGEADGVRTISASLFCGSDMNTTPAATTEQVPLTPEGDATIFARLDLPDTCLAPIVLVHPNGGLARYIAVSGWKS